MKQLEAVVLDEAELDEVSPLASVLERVLVVCRLS